MPKLARECPFPLLLGPMGAKQVDELGRQADRAAASLGLDPTRSGPDDLALGAESGRLAAGAAAAVRVPGRSRERRMRIVPFSRSTSFHWSPSASP